MKSFTTILIFVFVSIMTNSGAVAQEKPEEPEKVVAKPKHSTKVIMKLAMKDGLMKTVAEGKATHKQRLELLDLFVSLTENKPPMGKEASWNKFTTNAVLAAAKAAVGRDDAAISLKEATNCKTCHVAHKRQW